MSRSFKKHSYTGSKVFDYRCRCHGGCSYCESSRLLYTKIGEDLLKDGLKEIERWFNPRGRLRVVRLNIDNIQPLEDRLKTCPKQVKIDLTKAKQKIKMKLLNAPLVQLAEA